MNKKKLWLIIGGAVAALAIFIGVLCYLYWPGSRVVAGRLYADIQRTGYVFDSETGELLGTTDVTVTGTAKSVDGGTFDGEIIVAGYENTSDGVMTGTAGTEKIDGFVLIRYVQSCTHHETVEFASGYQPENDVTKNVTHICNYYYTVCLNPDDRDFAVVEVRHYYNDTLVYVVCADDEAEATERYQWYLQQVEAD